MSGLARRIERRIREAGAISLAEYMALALTDPREGYYMTADPLGAAGDFVTAPEVSQMFGELIGLWCLEVWQGLGRPAPFQLVELGPGRGTLMADLLRALRVLPEALDAASLHLIEVSPVLRRSQAERLAPLFPAARTQWHDSLGSLPELPSLVIANEFFDALPIRQFEKVEAGWCERMVTLDAPGDSPGDAPGDAPGDSPGDPAGRLSFSLGPASPLHLALIPEMLQSAPPGALVEVSPAGRAQAGDLGQLIASQGGAGLIVDYGHAVPVSGTTLQAVRAHGRADPLADPGAADLTALVDFTSLAAAAASAGAQAFGPIGQGRFLTALGIDQRAAALATGKTPAQAGAIMAARDRLIAPAAMGEHFKVLALAPPGFGAPPGFVGL